LLLFIDNISQKGLAGLLHTRNIPGSLPLWDYKGALITGVLTVWHSSLQQDALRRDQRCSATAQIVNKKTQTARAHGLGWLPVIK
jgi:hypothetical protein